MESISNPMPSISILVAEDEEITLFLLAKIISRKFPDAALHTANNGKTGLELFKTHMPEIIITDINMPGMDGMQMIDKIREIRPDTRFIVLTGNDRKHLLHDSAGKGCFFDHYIVKPVVFQELFAAIEQCIGGIAQRQS